jgi:hypothetical protein
MQKFRSNEEKLNEYTFFLIIFGSLIEVSYFLQKTFISLKKL